MPAFLSSLPGGDFFLLEGLGVLLALALSLAVRLTLGARRMARVSLALLAVNVSVFGLANVFPGGLRVLGPIAVLFLLLSIARSAVLLVLDALLEPRLDQPLPRIFRDIIQGAVYAVIAILTLRSAGVEPGSLLTTSALLTAVLGLSLQDTLGNMFAGLAIQMQRPFEVGDWIQFDGEQKNIGKVVEINWRATKVITTDEVEVTVPNGSLAKAPIKNFTKPLAASRRSLFVHVPFDVPPAEVHRAILVAIHDAPGVVAHPAPSVVTNQFTDSGIEYWVRFFTDAFDKRDLIDGGVRDRIWYTFSRAGIEWDVPHRAVHLHEVTEERAAREREKLLQKRLRALACVDFFRVLGDDDHRILAEASSSRLYAPGEVIVRQGDESDELFVIERGEVVVWLDLPGEPREIEVARLGPGKFFGEMALITGDPRQATVRAAASCELLEVHREAMQPILERAPELAERISGILAERQAMLERHANEDRPTIADVNERKSALLGKIKRLFAL